MISKNDSIIIFHIFHDYYILNIKIIKEYEKYNKLILKALYEIEIYVSKKKSILFTNKIYFLSHIIFSYNIESNYIKINKILAFYIFYFVFNIKEFNKLINYIDLFISK